MDRTLIKRLQPKWVILHIQNPSTQVWLHMHYDKKKKEHQNNVENPNGAKIRKGK